MLLILSNLNKCLFNCAIIVGATYLDHDNVTSSLLDVAVVGSI